MDAFTPALLARGLTGMIGKGPRNEEVKKCAAEAGAVYFAAIGGAGALIAKSIKSSEVVAFAESLEGVRKVNKSDVVAKTLENFNVLLAYISGAIIMILLIVAVFLISNTVSMGITIRREEIAIMKYIGAKDSFVRAPFVLEGVLIGLVGAAVPLTLLYFVYKSAIDYVMEKYPSMLGEIKFLSVGNLYLTLLPIGLALGVGIGFVGSFFTIRKHLKA
jgi:cell division transport system permease protein